MNLRIFLLFFIGHLIGDFILQFNYILKKRRSQTIKDIIWGNLLHSIIHWVVLILLLTVCFLWDKSFGFISYFKFTWVIVLTHFCIDIVKSLLILWLPSLDNNIAIFLLDQLLHIVVLQLAIVQFNLSKISTITNSLIKNYPANIHIIDRWLIVIIVFLICTNGVGIFIRKAISYIDYNSINAEKEESSNGDKGINNGGFIIGILERIVILLGIAISQPGIIGFVLTAKSIARFKKFDDDKFVEYFIIGTLISFITAIIGGIFIHSLKVIPLIK